MKYTQLPLEITQGGKTYELVGGECSGGKMFKGWWSYKYVEKNGGENAMPVQAGDKHSFYYLCSMEETKEKAVKDMLERLNTMIKIYDEEELKKFYEECNKRKQKNKK